jgi:acyl carrier protein
MFMDKTKENVIKLIAKVLGVSVDKIDDELAIGDIPEWDSLAHMNIISSLESEMGITLDIEEVLEIEDVEDIIEVVNSRE